jgi:hypothetical protein
MGDPQHQTKSRGFMMQLKDGYVIDYTKSEIPFLDERATNLSQTLPSLQPAPLMSPSIPEATAFQAITPQYRSETATPQYRSEAAQPKKVETKIIIDDSTKYVSSAEEELAYRISQLEVPAPFTQPRSSSRQQLNELTALREKVKERVDALFYVSTSSAEAKAQMYILEWVLISLNKIIGD